MVYQPIRSLGALNASLQEGLAAVKRAFDLLDTAPAIVDRPDTADLRIERGAVALDDVSFAYPNGADALVHVSLDIPAGATVALVGPSGAGKSTVLNLLLRFYEPDGGRILIDGQDIAGVTLASLRHGIALVSQDVTLFNDTVAANIGFGRPGAGRAAIVAAARNAAAHDFIEALPQGYDTIVGDRGVKLSGGQRQRVAIARAMLKDAPILLLDEATSALDAESELLVQQALRRLTAGRTTLVIAHRLATVMGADRIYVLDGGRLVEQGSHDDLKAGSGLYARLSKLQFADNAAAE
jgi:subfamily B ATP-binding cassette protein MsbA